MRADRYKIKKTAAENALLTLRNGTMVYLTDTGVTMVHDGVTPGGTTSVPSSAVTTAIDAMNSTQSTSAASVVGNRGGTTDPASNGSYVGQMYTQFTAGGAMIKTLIWNGTAWICWLLLACQAALGAIYPESYAKVFKVPPSDNEATNAINLVTTYEAAAATSGLNHTNRVLVRVPPGKYNFDNVRPLRLANFVDLVAEVQPEIDFFEVGKKYIRRFGAPQDGPNAGVRQSAQSAFRTMLHKTPACNATNRGTIIYQVGHIWSTRMSGLHVANWAGPMTQPNNINTGYLATNHCAMVVTNTPGVHPNGLAGGTSSELARTNLNHYSNMYFDTYVAFFATGATWDAITTIGHEHNVSCGGTWVNCGVSQHGWRMLDGSNSYGLFVNCAGSDRAFHTDPISESDTLDNCGVYGTYVRCVSDGGSFAGCASGAPVIHASARFFDCHAGDQSFGIGCVFNGQAYNCTAGTGSFAGSSSAAVFRIGTIGTNAVLVNCTAGTNSFASSNHPSDWNYTSTIRRSISNHPLANGGNGIHGVLRNCTINLSGPLALASGKLENCTIIMGERSSDDYTQPAIRLTAPNGQYMPPQIVGNRFVTLNGMASSMTNLITAQQKDCLVYIVGGNGYTYASTELAASQYRMMTNFAVPIVPGSVTIRYIRGGAEKIITDNDLGGGIGEFVGDVGATSGTADNRINYATGRYGVALEGQSDAANAIYARYTTMNLVRMAGNIIGATNLWSLTDGPGGAVAAITNLVTTPGDIVDPNIR